MPRIKIDIAGTRYGRLVVTKYSGNRDKWGKMLWDCLCDCGKEITRTKSDLEKYTRSCGCLKSESIFARCWKGCGQISGDYWRKVQDNAKKRNIEFDISIEEAWEIFETQNGKCALSGFKIELSQNIKKQEQTASLDRMDPKNGYIKGNVQWLHKKVNLYKHVQTNQEFLELCRLVVDHEDKKYEFKSN